MRVRRVGGELVLIGGQQPIGAATGRSAIQQQVERRRVAEHQARDASREPMDQMIYAAHARCANTRTG